ncbi:MAG: membrane protein insertase YidC [Gammaproteobacteria bacterium]
MFDNILSYVRIALYAALAGVVFFLYQAWQKEHPPVVATSAAFTQAETIPVGHAPTNQPLPQPSAAIQAEATAVAKTVPQTGQLISVKTDLLDIQIDTRGGDIVQAKLLQYPESLGSSAPFLLLNDDPKTRYIAESGLLSKQGPDTAAEQASYTATQTAYALIPGQQSLTVDLTWKKDGVTVIKTFTFNRQSYEVNVGYVVDNQSNKPWEGQLYTQLLRKDVPQPSNGGVVNLTTYFGAAISSSQKPFDKITFKQMQEKNLNQVSANGWAAMIQHYFVSAWIPPKATQSNYYSRVNEDGLFTIGMIGPQLVAAPGTKVVTDAKLYAGPAIASLLEKAAPGLKLTIDYGWFWFISDIIFWMMQHIYDVVGNWGWSIVLVTVVIKLLFFQLSAKSFRSMSAMKKLQPKIEALRERYKDNKQQLTQATLDLYRQAKVNPMSGCLPILIQIPVFIALYWVLVESVQLRQAPFILWIHDLSQQDPYYILPLLMGISMFIQQKLNPPPADPMQAKVMMLMPVVFTVLFANFPAGLMLYWFVNNTLSVLQQWFIMNRLEINLDTNGKKSSK